MTNAKNMCNFEVRRKYRKVIFIKNDRVEKHKKASRPKIPGFDEFLEKNKSHLHREEKLWGKIPLPPFYNDLFESVNLVEFDLGIAALDCPMVKDYHTKRSL